MAGEREMLRTEEQSAHPRVVLLGDVMTDIVVRPAGPIALGSDTPSVIETHAGGSAGNQATWLAFADLDVHFIGCIGKDAFGQLHRTAFERSGVVAHLAVDAQRPTGTVVSLVDPLTGERSMLAERGANAGLAEHPLPDDVFRPGGCFHLSGYALLSEDTRPVALAALALARERGLRVSVDPASAAPLGALGVGHFLEWTQGADLCFPNLEEACLLTGEDEPEAAARALLHWYGEVALKLGPDGAIWASADEPTLWLPCEPVDTIDSTGAGDAFCAGFLSQRLHSASPAEALAAGVHLGAVVAGRVGARPDGADLSA
ncbi:MAG TPA: sugar kinase [Ktedonobacterales bacterium]|nr:sugar kinase [Ktedonobacterales bacterium]